MDKFILAIDQGTTSTRAMVLDRLGQTQGEHQIPLRQFFPHNGWVEHDPEEIWQTTLITCHTASKNAGIQPQEIAAIGITNQRETTVIWHRKTGQPIYKAIVWQDRRTAEFCQQLIAAGKEKIINAKTGLLLDPYFSASKIAWILDNVPAAREQAEDGELAFGTIDCFLLWRLTGGKVHATDVTNASRTAIFNIQTLKWDRELLKIFNIPEKILPQVLPNCADFGVTDKNLFGAAIPVAAMAGDQQAALVGQTCFQPGSVKSTYGTGCFLLFNTGEKLVFSQHRLLTTIAYQLAASKPIYAIEGSIFAAGSVVQWLRDQLNLIKTAAESEALAASLPDNQGVYLVPAFTGLGAPYWDPYARGAFLGLTRDSNKAHLVRAGLEAIVYQTRDLITAMEKDGAQKPLSLRVDGGMANNNWLMQFLADILEIKIERSAKIEMTALGVAYLAGLQIGIYKSLTEIEAIHKVDKVFEPELSVEKRNQYYQGWKQVINLILAPPDAKKHRVDPLL